MAIKLKNRYISKIAYLAAVLVLGYSIVSAGFLVVYYENFTKNNYFDSNSFKYEVVNLTHDVVGYHITYKDYDKKNLDDKVDKQDVEDRKKMYEENLKQRTEQIDNNYNWQIDQAQKSNDKDTYKRLTEEKAKELEAANKENNKTLEEIKKDLAAPGESEYSRLKSTLAGQKGILYYITNKKTGEIYTDIKGLSSINDYIKSNTLWYQKYPLDYQGSKDLSTNEINTALELNSLEGYFLVPSKSDGYSHIYSDYKNFQYIKEQTLKNGIIGGKLFVASLLLFVISAVFKVRNSTNKSITSLYVKVPLEIRLALIITATVIYLNVLFEVGRSILNEPVIAYIAFSLALSIYLLFALPHITGFFNLLSDKDYFISQIKGTLIFRLCSMLRRIWTAACESFIYRTPIAYAGLLMLTSIIFGITFAILVSGSFDEFGGIIILLIFAGYFALVYKFVFKQLGYFNRIVKGSEAIISGNLGFAIQENGKGILSMLAHNINNMKKGLQEALQSEMKSERLKSELITNVSHDLKTPLTSIINYVDLIKREDISKDEFNSYIEILDRKAQRLKVLIEDLFDASKMASGSVELDITSVDVGALLKQSLAEFDEKIQASSLIFRVTVPEHKLMANLDGKKTWRVFENLIGNILKYSQPSTRVYIDLVELDNKIVLIMKNISGYEMDFSVDEIFERFKRGDKSRHTEGSGLGLAIAKSIVELQGGKLNIEIDGDLFKVIVEFVK